MKICYRLLSACFFIIQNHQSVASDSRPPVHAGLTMFQQDQQKKMQEEHDAFVQKMAICSVRQSLQQARALRITTEFTQEESIELSQIFKEPALGEEKGEKSTPFDREWAQANHHEHKVIAHSHVLSPETKMELIMEDFKDEDL